MESKTKKKVAQQNWISIIQSKQMPSRKSKQKDKNNKLNTSHTSKAYWFSCDTEVDWPSKEKKMLMP